jgi:tRNA(Ile)-lysidine synthase
LLFATRQSIEIYCRKNRIRYREDQSNTETKYTRNKIRHLVVPILKEINPSVETTLNETAGRLREVNDILTGFISKLYEKSIIRENNILKISIKTLKQFADNDTILYELLKKFGISGNNLPDLKNIIKGKTGIQIFTGTHRIIKNREELLITRLAGTTPRIIRVNNLNELKKKALFQSIRLVRVTSEFVIPSDKTVACIDYEKVIYPLIIRKWEAGDFFYPLGMKRKKKLSDYLVDRKYSRPEKEKLLLLESDGRIIWLTGERIDDRFRITKLTRKALIIRTQRSK